MSTNPMLKPKRILLLQLYSHLQAPTIEPFSIEVLAGAIKTLCPNWQIDLFVINPQINENYLLQLAEKLNERDRFSVIGLSIPQGTFDLSHEIIQVIYKECLPFGQPTIVLGHAIPSTLPEAYLLKYENLIILSGWSELPLTILLKSIEENNLPLSSIPNLIYRSDNAIVRNSSINLPTPSIPLRIEAKQYFSRIESSRGCQYGACTFCTRSGIKNDNWTRLPIEKTILTIKDLHMRGIRTFTFTDEDFLGNDIIGANKIADYLLQLSDMKFSFATRSDSISNNSLSDNEKQQRLALLNKLKEAGLYKIFIGVESLSANQLRRYNKGVNLTEMIEAINLVKKDVKVDVEIGFILFDPFVTIKELKENSINLRKYSLWENLSHLFSLLRVEYNSAYYKKFKNFNLFGKLDPNMLMYSWRFYNKDIASLARISIEWSLDFSNIFRLIKNLDRGLSYNFEIKKIMNNLRLQDLNILDDLLSPLQTIHQLNIPEHCLHERIELVKNLRLYLLTTKEKVYQPLLAQTETYLTRKGIAYE